MDVVLIAGFWLDASSWDAVLPALHEAGHRTHPLTLPGMESVAADRAGIGLQDHVDAVVALVDELPPESVVLVGHSGGGAVAHAAADARPDRVQLVIYVDCLPLGDGDCINAGLPAVAGDIPLPEWSVFDAEDVVGLTDDLRDAFRRRAIPTPLRVATDPQRLHDVRRYDVPSTVIACEFSAADLQAYVDQQHPFVAEFARLRDVTVIDLPTGHWPQFTRPDDVAHVLVDAIAAVSAR